jgi:hypothetical protein
MGDDLELHMQRELRKSEQVRTGQLKDLNKRPTKRPASYLLICHLSGIIILKHGSARHLPRNGIRVKPVSPVFDSYLRRRAKTKTPPRIESNTLEGSGMALPSRSRM